MCYAFDVDARQALVAVQHVAAVDVEAGHYEAPARAFSRAAASVITPTTLPVR